MFCVLVVAMLGAQGCSYLRDRRDDAAEMFDLGFTFSKKPQFSAYVNCPIIVPLGYGKVDGYFVGVGGGKVGLMKHHQESSGLLVWGREEVSWESFDPQQTDTLSVQGVGVLGLAEGQEGEKAYTPACIHYLHLGWIGIAANVRWLEIPDFFLGLFLLDPMGDDGESGGWWFWGSRGAAEPPPSAAVEGPMGENPGPGGSQASAGKEQ
jgi:hypothetical protein